MTSSNILRLIALAEELQQKIDQTVVLEGNKPKLNEQFEAQREFGRQFNDKLRALLSELNGDLYTLQARRFDSKMWRLLVNVKSELEKILSSLKENRPHEAAWKLVDYVNNRSTKSILDNLEFLSQHHMHTTQPTGKLPPTTKHTEIQFFQHLKGLATELKAYMELNPPLPVPGSGPPPPRENPAAQHPDIAIGPEAKTKG